MASSGPQGFPSRDTPDTMVSGRVIDLTFPLDERLQEPIVEWVPGLSLTPTATCQTLGRSVHRVVMATHCGTHVDAPAHFFEDGVTIDHVPFSQLIGEAILPFTPCC